MADKKPAPQGNRITGRIHLRKENHKLDFEIGGLELAKKCGIPDRQRYIVEFESDGRIIATPM